jgi:hypothetical protein
MLGFTLGAIRVAVPGVLPAAGLDEAEPDVAVEDAPVGGVLDAVKTALLFRLAPLTDDEVAVDFPAVAEIVAAE